MADDEVGARLRLRGRREFSQDAKRSAKDIDDMRKAAAKANHQARQLGQGLRQVGAGLGTLGGHLHGVTRAANITAAALLAASAAVVTYGLKSAASLELQQVGLEALTGSASAATDVFEFLKRIDPLAPFDIGQLGQIALQVGNIGLRGADLEAQLQGIVDVAALAPDRLGDISYAINQIRGSSRLMTQDLRQLNNAGVNIGSALENAFGIGFGEFLDRVERGEHFDSGLFLESLFSNSSGRAEQIATETITGLLSGVRSRIQLKLADAASPLIETLKEMLPRIEELVGSLLDRIAPPLFTIVGHIVDILVDLMPVIEGPLQALAEGLEAVLGAAGPLEAALRPFQRELVGAIEGFFEALVPHVPDLIDFGVALLRLAPAAIEIATALLPLAMILARLLTSVLEMEHGPKIILATFLALKALSMLGPPLIFVGQAMQGVAAIASALGVSVGAVAVTVGWILLIVAAVIAVGVVIFAHRQKIGGFFLWLGERIGALVQWFEDLPGRLLAAADGMWDFLFEYFRQALNVVIEMWNGFEIQLPSFEGWEVGGRTIIPSWEGPTLGTPDIPRLHSGGTTTSGGLVNMRPGEEMVVLPPAASVVPLQSDDFMRDVPRGRQVPRVVSVQLNRKEIARAMIDGVDELEARR